MVRDIQFIDDDICYKKRIIEQMLYSDPDIIEVLNNPQLDPNYPEEYVYDNIHPYIRVPGTQDVSKNFICFNVDDMEQSPANQIMKIQYIQFIVFVHKDLVRTQYGVARHDLLAYLIRDIFNFSNALGAQMELVSNRESVTDTDFCTRTLRFEMVTTNSIKPYKTNSYEIKSIVERKDKNVRRETVGGD